MYGNIEENKEDEYKMFPFIMSEVSPHFSYRNSWYFVY